MKIYTNNRIPVELLLEAKKAVTVDQPLQIWMSGRNIIS